MRDPRVEAAALAIAATESRAVRTTPPVVSAADYHDAIAAVRAVDEVTPSALTSILEMHAPVRRYKASFHDAITYPTTERAFQVNLNDSMRGFESIPLGRPEEATFIEVCGECSRVENSFDQGSFGYDDDHDDEHDGTELSTKASVWPCATYLSVIGPATSWAHIKPTVLKGTR